ncbi:HAD-IA family hydrolase [Qipengyuania nanhaisediminis]|uniref:Phosphoglycolate phosphatase n=1 Tax=Qipengyuania nanhaisediminis TaxID=604088 RepID=A0A1I5NKW5_9SPHN|nr:HAD-IA family hydrolase [Qipengyuania nanhaisediminis]SFP21871.1 phosphoglycolate phosphatase [Qipengyuania nanhaisediminis]
MTRLAVFDCDGTLVDGQAAVCETMERAFAAIGSPPPERNAIRRTVGLSLPLAMRQLMTDGREADRLQVVEAYKRLFRETRLSGALHEPLYDGMADLLARLDEDGWLLGVATGKSDRGLHSCLETHGIKQHFVTLHGADRYPSKPHPAMLEAALDEAGVGADDAVMIGDTSFDIEMAGAAGVRAIGVAWGYHDPAELMAAGAQSVASTMEELENMIRGR